MTDSNFITWPYRLVKGHSKDPSAGACVNAAIAWLVHGEHTDWPPCVDPLIRAFTIVANDCMADKTRQRFLLFAPRMAGSLDSMARAARLRIMVLAAVRVFLPRALDAAGMRERAAEFRAIQDDTDYAEIVEMLRMKKNSA